MIDFPAIERALELSDGGRTMATPAWLAESAAAPDAFWCELAIYAGEALGLRSKTVESSNFELYHDLVLRHLPRGGVAFREPSSQAGEWSTLTYAELDEASAIRAGAWAAAGLEPGSGVALLLEAGRELLVSVLAALKAELIFSIVPPLGHAFVRRRLEAAAPQAVFTLPAHAALCADQPALFPTRAAPLPGDGGASLGETVARLFSPLRDPPSTPVEVAAETIWRGLIWDGVIIHRLRPGRALAAPGWGVLRGWPGLPLAALYCGATFTHLPMNALQARPQWLSDLPIDSLGVTPALRDLLLSLAEPLEATWGAWFRDPSAPLEWQPWRDLLARPELAERACVNLYPEFGAGLLCSPRRRGTWAINQHVIPAPGRPWALAAVDGSGQGAFAEAGLFDPDGDGALPLDAVLSARGTEWFFAGTLDPRRAARTWPVDEVLAAAERAEGVLGASAVSLPSGQHPNLSHHLLLIFTGPDGDRGAALAAVEARIRYDLGADFLPDRVEVYPLLPRREGGAIDHGWCRVQYFAGLLHQKSHHPAFEALTRARFTFLNASEPCPP